MSFWLNKQTPMSPSRTTTWRTELTKVLQEKGETFADLVFATEAAPPADQQAALAQWLDVPWERGYGSWAPAFVAWGPNWVYQSKDYDGAYHVDCVPRHPTGAICALTTSSAG